MNIAVVFDAFSDQSIGSLVSTLRFGERLRKRGHKIIFIAAKYPGRPDVDYFKGFKVYRFRSVLLPRTEKKFYVCFPKKKEIEEILKKEKIGILHLMVPTPAAMTSVKAAKGLGISIVAHSHTQPENIFMNIPKVFNAQRIYDISYKYMIRIYSEARIILCPSKFAERILKGRDPSLKTCVVSNGVDLSKFRKINADSFLRKFGVPKKCKKLLFVGRLHPEKNVEVLIRALPLIKRKISDIRLLIIGAGYLMEPLKKLAKDLGLGENVLFLGRVGDKDILGAFNACDIFTLPSLAELEGMVVLEAMACGKPILIANSRQSASRDFVDENGLLFDPFKPEDLAQKALRILENKETYKKMAENSYKKSREYDINRSVLKVEKIYRSL